MTPRRPRRPSGPGPRGDVIVDDLEQPRVTIRVHRAPADRVYRSVVRLAASATLLVMGLIGAFLFARALPALRSGGWRFLTEQAWTPDSGRFGISAVLLGTVLIAVVALVAFAGPDNVFSRIALFFSEMAVVTFGGADQTTLPASS